MELDYAKVAKIAFIEKGDNKPFVFGVYENGTIVVWIDEEDLSEDEIKAKCNACLDEFPGFTPGTPDADFNVSSRNVKMFGDLADKISFVTYPHHPHVGGSYMSCVINPPESQGEIGFQARENLEKDFQDRKIIYVGSNVDH